MALPIIPFTSSQVFLPIKQIRDGIIILKDNTLRGILMVSSVNFELRSSEEQEAIIYQFQNFLNSLDFSCQILVCSRKINITGYLDRLKEVEEKQKNELLQNQIREYRNFINQLVTGGSIMNKSFYLVVPFYLGEKKKSALFQFQGPPQLTEELFKQYKIQLYQRMEFLALGLRRCALWAMPLNTEEIIELLWSYYHPKEAQVGYYPEIPPELIIS
ncbi:hypothetical protein J7L09_00145 [bacterium]|nr:hypothetical protein [bacterium]